MQHECKYNNISQRESQHSSVRTVSRGMQGGSLAGVVHTYNSCAWVHITRNPSHNNVPRADPEEPASQLNRDIMQFLIWIPAPLSSLVWSSTSMFISSSEGSVLLVLYCYHYHQQRIISSVLSFRTHNETFYFDCPRLYLQFTYKGSQSQSSSSSFMEGGIMTSTTRPERCLPCWLLQSFGNLWMIDTEPWMATNNRPRRHPLNDGVRCELRWRHSTNIWLVIW